MDLDEEVAVMALGRRLQIAHVIRDGAESPLDIPTGPAGVVIVGGKIAAQHVAAVIELPAGYPAPDLCNLLLKCDLIYN